ncbi:ImmA/IrrE family metallo-endopeptidase [Tuberibacillus sp. Marseille-P3662]|uniref:ImmA/IrrE family metallo-endopeptidase n=1 Tax=Tuberibacillus sp. Marseille-P3662 TaxID=1965358 RepID=UPI000A1CDBC5|nr:ImmA/IrrE family metallo-endopeptidase [Tuberibacillus sp. Marseille-P3662]
MKWVKDNVGTLIKKCKTNDPFEIANFINVHVVPWDLHEEINGFYKYDRRNKYIFYNSNLGNEMQYFVCAHELGHAVLHPKVNTPFLRSSTFFSINKIEVEANTFAVELLIPDKVIYDQCNSRMTIQEAASTYNVPHEVAHLKNF